MKCDDCDKSATCIMVRQPGENNENYLFACEMHCDHPWCDMLDFSERVRVKTVDND